MVRKIDQIFNFDAAYDQIKPVSVALDLRDIYTREHRERVALLAEELGRSCQLHDSDVVILRIVSMLHDVGKIGLPDRVLFKPGPLDPEEWEIVKTHSVKGERIVAHSKIDFAIEIGRIVRHHHERFEGGGYPDGVSREAIPRCHGSYPWRIAMTP
jgi:HD-GYP domain-containing protein (c-di-GMP phosphodiesterase class II)